MKNTILIVDDVRLNIDALCNILGDSYKIMAAVSGKDAISIMERKKPDLVLLDIYMPDMNGFDVLQYMKKSQELEKIPVIFVTAESDTNLESKGLELGAVDYIKKPFRSSIIKSKVQTHLELITYRDHLKQLVSERTKSLEELAKQISASRNAVIMGMSLMSEIHDSTTGSHIERIKTYTSILCNKMLELFPNKLDEETARETVLYSPLHDVGKVAISDTILKKSASLTDEEFQIIKKHTIYGAELLKNTEKFFSSKDAGLKVAIDIAESHHEKYDGSGYPYGKKGDEIPISARIVCIADIYDAFLSVRPYKEPFTHEEAVDIILNGDGRIEPSHFDPDVLTAFKLCHQEFKEHSGSQK